METTVKEDEQLSASVSEEAEIGASIEEISTLTASVNEETAIEAEIEEDESISATIAEDSEIEVTIEELTATTADISNEFYRGYSAYEVAVMNGYRGTQTQWLNSLKGATWGSIHGTIGDQADLQAALKLKVNTSDTITNTQIKNLFE